MSQVRSQRDEEFLARRGITRDEVDRQVEILLAQKQGVTLVRPGTIGDGIRTIAEPELAELAALYDASVEAGRWMKFVPASGAASRMFALDEDDARKLCENLSAFAFYEDLAEACRRNDRDLADLLNRKAYGEIVATLLDESGLNYSFLPKGLLKFHRYSNESRTAFEEHLREAARCFCDRDGRARLHFTVSDDHLQLFKTLLEQLRPIIQQQLNANLQVAFSLQKPSTDTVALEESGEILRDESGDIVLRPGGHGALLENLMDLNDGDLVFVKNIDNICHQRLSGPTQTWIRALGGYLVQLQKEARDADDRPLRVCGMVRNEGEPGGGPFWVRERDGSESLQIVESAELEDSDEQQAIFNRATHFNPVLMMLGLRDANGKRHDLHDFVNRDRFICTKKVEQGRPVHALERPGLWNGTMHGWQTVFVEVPKEVFSPVKTVFDLLRDEHQE